MLSRKTAEEELKEQVAVVQAPEMVAKHTECNKVQQQLAAIERKIGTWVQPWALERKIGRWIQPWAIERKIGRWIQPWTKERKIVGRVNLGP